MEQSSVLFLLLYLLGSQGGIFYAVGFCFIRPDYEIAWFIWLVSPCPCLPPTPFTLKDIQVSSVSYNIVCVHQVAELLYLNVPFASVWVLGITSLIIIKGDAMVFIILHCTGNWTQNLMHAGHSTLLSNISNLITFLKSVRHAQFVLWEKLLSCFLCSI